MALAKGKMLLGIKECSQPNQHSALAAVFANQLLQENQLDVSQLHAVCVSAGPGSYTGLRIGVGLAKGICYSASIPLLAVSTLSAMALHVIDQSYSPDALYCPMIDARRMEVYTALYDAQGNILMPERPIVLNEKIFSDYHTHPLLVFGSGANKFKLVKPEAILLDYTSSASHLITPALTLFANGNYADVAYFEPNYLKPFHPGSDINSNVSD